MPASPESGLAPIQGSHCGVSSKKALCLHKSKNYAAQPTNLSCIKKEKNIYDIHNSPGPSVGPCGSH